MLCTHAGTLACHHRDAPAACVLYVKTLFCRAAALYPVLRGSTSLRKLDVHFFLEASGLRETVSCRGMGLPHRQATKVDPTWEDKHLAITVCDIGYEKS